MILTIIGDQALGRLEIQLKQKKISQKYFNKKRMSGYQNKNKKLKIFRYKDR